MLQQGNPSPELHEWLDRLAPVVEEAQTRLRTVTPERLAIRSGCNRDKDGNFCLRYLWREYVVSRPDFAVRRADSGDEPPSFTQSLILTYLATADGTTPSGRWIGFRDLPDGMFYAQAFQGYTGNRLVRELRPAVEGLRRAAERLGGTSLDMGSAGYAFTILPRVSLGLAFWEGDEEFPSQARVLFEDSAAHYMTTDGLAILGSQLVGKVLRAAKQE